MHPPLRVVPLRAERADEAAVLVREVIEPLPYYNARAREEELAKYTAVNLRALVESDPLSVLVADNVTRLAGFCISRYDDGLVWLAWFGTHPDARGVGVGTTLLHALGATLSERHAHKVWCDTRTDNVHSQSLLERVGFQRLVALSNHWYGQDFILWEWYPAPEAASSPEGRRH